MNTQLNEYVALKNYHNRIQEANRNAERRLVTKDYAPKRSIFVSATTLSGLVIILSVIIVFVVL